MNTTYYKEHHKVETTLIINEEKRQQLKIYTCKGRGLIRTRASVSIVSEDGMYLTHAMFKDYSKELNSKQVARATEKALREFHDEQLNNIESIVEDVYNFYKNK